MRSKVAFALLGAAVLAAGIGIAIWFRLGFIAEVAIAVGVWLAAVPWLAATKRPLVALPESENPTVGLASWRQWSRPVAFLGAFIVAAVLFASLRVV